MLDKDFKILSKFDKEKLWADINNKVGKLQMYYRIKIVGSIAASLLIFFLSFHYIAENKEREERREIVAFNKSNPVLINEKGNRIALNESVINNTLSSVFLDSIYNGKSQNIATQKKNKYNVLMIPRGAEFKLILADSTVVWMNSGSKIKYPTNFSGNNRKVFLEGEAYFQVKRNEHKPFIVYGNDFQVKVLGTRFNVSNYKDDDFSHVTLESGKVQINKGGVKKLLAPSEQAYMGKDNMIIRKVNTGNFISWRGSNFIFQEETLENIMKKLSRWYDVEVFYETAEIRDIHLTCRILKYGNIEEVMALIKRVANIRYNINKRCIVVGRAKG